MYDVTMEKIRNKILWQSKLINLCLSSSRVNTVLFSLRHLKYPASAECDAFRGCP